MSSVWLFQKIILFFLQEIFIYLFILAAKNILSIYLFILTAKIIYLFIFVRKDPFIYLFWQERSSSFWQERSFILFFSPLRRMHLSISSHSFQNIQCLFVFSFQKKMSVCLWTSGRHASPCLCDMISSTRFICFTYHAGSRDSNLRMLFVNLPTLHVKLSCHSCLTGPFMTFYSVYLRSNHAFCTNHCSHLQTTPLVLSWWALMMEGLRSCHHHLLCLQMWCPSKLMMSSRNRHRTSQWSPRGPWWPGLV